MSKLRLLFLGQEADAPHQNMFFYWGSKAACDVEFVLSAKPKKRRGIVLSHAFKLASSYIALFRDVLVRPRYDIIIISSYANLFRGLIVILFRSRCVVVYQSQDWLERKKLPAQVFAEKYICRRSDLVVWNEVNRAKRAFTDYGLPAVPSILPTYLPKKFKVGPLGAQERNDLRSKWKLNPDALAIFAGGSFKKDRLSGVLIEVSARIKQPHYFIFTGQRPQLLETSDHFQFIGFQTYEQVLQAAAACDVGLLLYEYENSFGNQYQQPGRLTEYLRSGIPFVSTPFPAAQEIAKLGFGVITDATDPEKLASALVETAYKQSDQLRDVIASYAEEYLSYDSAAADLLENISQLARSGR